MSDCKVFRAEIEEAADGGALGPRAAAHAEVCAACGEELRGLAALRGLVRGLGCVEAPADFEYRLRARMARSKPGGGRGVFGGLFPLSGLAWAATAVCVLSVTAAVYFTRTRPSTQNAPGVAASAGVRQAPARQAASEQNNARRQAERQSEQAGGGQAAAVSNAPVIAQRASNVNRAASQPRARELARREPRADPAQGGSLVAGFGSARIHLPELNSGVQAQGIQLGTTAGTLRVTLRDERGALVPMRSVSFGSQEPLSRQTAGARTSTQDEEGVW